LQETETRCPTGNEKRQSLEAIDWDEFHPTSPYDVYVPRTPPRKKWSIVLGILLYLVGQFSRVTVLTAASYSRGRNFFQRSPQHSFQE